MSNLPVLWNATYDPLTRTYRTREGRYCDELDLHHILAPESEKPVADEIRNQNVVAVWLEADTWHARIGPEGQGLEAKAAHPARALRTLASALEIKGWPFDPSYRPRPEPSFHDA